MKRIDGVDDNARGTNGAVYAVRLAGLADTHPATHAIKILYNFDATASSIDVQNRHANEHLISGNARLPAHPSLQPVLHHFVDVIPSSLPDYCWDTVAIGSPAAFIVMDLRQMSLHGLLTNRRKAVAITRATQPLLTPNEVVALLIPLASALLTLATENVVYPDIKPSNILLQFKDRSVADILARDGAIVCTPVISGFGRALDLHALHLQDAKVPAHQLPHGTVAYLAPELLVKSGMVDVSRVMVYSFGCVARDLMLAVTNDFTRVRTTDDLPAVYPILLRNLVVECLQTNPALRPMQRDIPNRLGAIHRHMVGESFRGADIHTTGALLASMRPISLMSSQPPSSGQVVQIMVTVYFKHWNGHVVEVSAYNTDTIGAIKAILERQEGLHHDEYRLLYGGRVMDDDRSLHEYNVHTQTTLHLARMVASKPAAAIEAKAVASSSSSSISKSDEAKLSATDTAFNTLMSVKKDLLAAIMATALEEEQKAADDDQRRWSDAMTAQERNMSAAARDHHRAQVAAESKSRDERKSVVAVQQKSLRLSDILRRAHLLCKEIDALITSMSEAIPSQWLRIFDNWQQSQLLVKQEELQGSVDAMRSEKTRDILRNSELEVDYCVVPLPSSSAIPPAIVPSRVDAEAQAHADAMAARAASQPVASSVSSPVTWTASPASSIVAAPVVLPPIVDTSMALFVKHMSGTSVQVDCNETDTIAILKQRIHKLRDAWPPSCQRLIFAGKCMEDEKTVGQYGVAQESLVHLTITSPVAGGVVIPRLQGDEIAMNIRHMTGRVLFVQVRPKDTILILKARIQQADASMPIAEQRLISAGQQLDDTKTLEDYSLSRESTIHLVRKPATPVVPATSVAPVTASMTGSAAIAGVTGANMTASGRFIGPVQPPSVAATNGVETKDSFSGVPPPPVLMRGVSGLVPRTIAPRIIAARGLQVDSKNVPVRITVQQPMISFGDDGARRAFVARVATTVGITPSLLSFVRMTAGTPITNGGNNGNGNGNNNSGTTLFYCTFTGDRTSLRRFVDQAPLLSSLYVPYILLGDFRLNVAPNELVAEHHKFYAKSTPHHWSGSLARGPKASTKGYYCPWNFQRFALKVSNGTVNFDEKFGDWYVAYHGTSDQHAATVLDTGLVATHRAHHWISGTSLRVSPSIEYASHFTNSRPWRLPSGEWQQMVMQLRVHPMAIAAITGDAITLRTNDDPRIDPNFANNELEWRIQPVADESKLKDLVVCYGLMVRIAADPCSLAASQWWHATPDALRQSLPNGLTLPAPVVAPPVAAAAAAARPSIPPVKRVSVAAPSTTPATTPAATPPKVAAAAKVASPAKAKK